MKKIFIPNKTYSKIKKLQEYFKVKTITETIDRMILDTATHEFEYEDLTGELLKDLI